MVLIKSMNYSGSKLSYCEFVHNFLKFNFQTINKKRAPIRTPSQPTTCELESTHNTRPYHISNYIITQNKYGPITRHI